MKQAILQIKPWNRIFSVLIVLFLPGVFQWGGSSAISAQTVEESSQTLDATMLMFVGEALDVVTVASRTPESPSTAPAVVRVVDRKEIRQYGYRTLSELLSAQPGFYMMEQGAGSRPFLRGIANGILLLYDGVPIPTNGSRSFYPLDFELSLNSVKQVEIIRGPGSVLWGADAFAGIVNVVPLSGKDQETEEVEIVAGTDSLLTGFAGKGVKKADWDAYLSVYGAQNRQGDDSFVVDAVFSETDQEWLFSDSSVDDSEYYEMTLNANWGEHFSLSGRFSDYNTPYTRSTYLEDIPTPISWASKKKAPVNHVKINYTNRSGRSHFNVTGYYQDVTYSRIDADVTIDESFDIYYGEMLWDRRIFQKGLLTAGLSYRETHVDGAIIEGQGFIPEFLLNENFDASLSIATGSYHYSVLSLFGQYRHPFSWGEFWAGFRVDDYSVYDNYAPSMSMGVNLPLDHHWRIKTVLGTGYRTAYSQQISDEDDKRTRDHISTLSLQTEWSPGKDHYFSATAYYSMLSDNVQVNHAGGDSEPSDMDFSGFELYYKKKLTPTLQGYVSLSKVFFNEDAYHYTVVGYEYLRPDGSFKPTYETWSEPYESGANFTCASGIVWQIHPKATISATAAWSGDIPYSYEANTISGSYQNPLLINSELRLTPWGDKNLTFSIGSKNVLDGDFTYPGEYGPISGDPLTVYGAVEYRF